MQTGQESLLHLLTPYTLTADYAPRVVRSRQNQPPDAARAFFLLISATPPHNTLSISPPTHFHRLFYSRSTPDAVAFGRGKRGKIYSSLLPGPLFGFSRLGGSVWAVHVRLLRRGWLADGTGHLYTITSAVGFESRGRRPTAWMGGSFFCQRCLSKMHSTF